MQQYTGKLIAGLIGFLTLGVVGLLFGLAIGHAFDRGLWSALQASGPEGMAKVQQQFFDTTFTLLGYIAKADGRVSEAEIAQAESLFAQLRLNPTQRANAIARFRAGTAADFDPAGTVSAFAAAVGPRRQVQHTLFAFLASMALADGNFAGPEQAALHRVAALLGMPTHDVDRLVAMLEAQARFHSTGYRARGQGSGAAPARDRLADAYQALGIGPEVTDAELKKAYRRLMSENHPDKLMSKGVPDDLVKMATERSQEISNAYQVIRESRGLA